MSELELYADGRLDDLEPETRRHLLERATEDAPELSRQVTELMAEVRADGDAALRRMAGRFDGVTLESIEVPRDRWTAARDRLDPGVRAALERAADNIRRFHEAQIPDDVTVEVEPGVRITRRWTALERVGVYAPGGRASYPSSVLMGVVPAVAAGVDEVVVCSPPVPGEGSSTGAGTGGGGVPGDAVLAACAIGGADRLFALGGAGAVAALAFGTESVPAVDAVVGPGNRWVTEAKRQVAGRLLIDSPAGPSEVLVLADDATDPELAAHELLAQAEHDPEAACVLVSTDAHVLEAVRTSLMRLLEEAPRAEVARTALAAHGAFLLAGDRDQALAFTEAWAPEHLSVLTRTADDDARRIRTAGTTFVGPWASVAFGDYLTGANHVLPTAGRARSFSGLSTHHFLRSFTVQEIDEEGAASMAEDVACLARAEGLPAHGQAALARASTDPSTHPRP